MASWGPYYKENTKEFFSHEKNKKVAKFQKSSKITPIDDAGLESVKNEPHRFLTPNPFGGLADDKAAAFQLSLSMRASNNSSFYFEIINNF